MGEHRPANTVRELTTALVRSKLADEEQVNALVHRFHQEYLPATNVPETITAFCTFLVLTGTITTWQCGKLRDGRWKGFFDLEGYIMLDNLGTDADFAYYLGRDIRDATLVRLAVTPRCKWADSTKIEFRVDDRFGQSSGDTG